MTVDDDILREVVMHITPMIQIYGIYVVFHGHLSPGGGFSGGVVLALSMVLFMLVFGRKEAMSHLIYRGKPEGDGPSWQNRLKGYGLLMDMDARVPLGLVAGLLVIGLKLATFFASGLIKIPLGTPGRLFSSGSILIVTLGVGFMVASTIITLFMLLVGEGPHDGKPYS